MEAVPPAGPTGPTWGPVMVAAKPNGPTGPTGGVAAATRRAPGGRDQARARRPGGLAVVVVKRAPFGPHFFQRFT